MRDVSRAGHAAVVGVALLAAFAIGFEFRLVALTPGLDVSYIYAFNRQALDGARWGRDFVSTYGPFGHLIWTMSFDGLIASRVVTSIALTAAFGLAAAWYVSTTPGLGVAARLAGVVALAYAFSIQDPEYRWLALLALLLLIGVLSGGAAGVAAMGLAGGLAGFCLLLKFSLGLSAAITVTIGALLSLRLRVVARRLAAAVAGLGIGLGGGWLASGGTLADIAPYVASGLEMAGRYSSAMTAYAERWWTTVAAFLVWFALLALWIVVQPTRRKTVAMLALAFPLFAAWKHSVVRQDDFHVAILVRFGVLVLVVLCLETAAVWSWKRAVPAAAVLAVPLAIAWVTAGAPRLAGWAGEMVMSPLAFRGVTHLARLADVPGYRAEVQPTSKALMRRSRLPGDVRKVIGSASVDIYPWEISYVAENALDWVHRPIPASFNAFTAGLDARNAAFLRSDRRPEFMIWHRGLDEGGLESIDGRHVFWDEPETLSEILRRYDARTTTPRALVLEARPAPRFGAPEAIGAVDMQWGERGDVPQVDGALLVRPRFERSLAASLVALVFRAQPLLLHAWFDDGRDRVFRLVSDNDGAPLWLSPLPDTLPDLARLFADGSGRRVVAIAFVGSRVLRTFAPTIRVEWLRLPVRGPA